MSSSRPPGGSPACTRRLHALVVNHGEPFPGNVFETPTGERRLIDLGGFTLAPKEKDLGYLRMLAAPEDRDVPARAYAAAIGHDIDIDEEIAGFYAHRWGREEITQYVDQLSRPHPGDRQDDFAWTELTTHYLPLA